MKTYKETLQESAQIFIDVFVAEYGKQGAINKFRELSVKFPLSVYTIALDMIQGKEIQ